MREMAAEEVALVGGVNSARGQARSGFLAPASVDSSVAQNDLTETMSAIWWSRIASFGPIIETISVL